MVEEEEVIGNGSVEIPCNLMLDLSLEITGL
jgi:hypothetical protein